PLTVGLEPRQVLVYDWNGDGKLDIVTVNRSGSNVSWAISKGVDGNGVLSFNAVATQPPPGPVVAPIAAGIADLDGDRLPDIVIADANSPFIRVYFNRTMMGGPIALSMPTSYATASLPVGAVMADFNQDGNMDFATANDMDSSISVFMGKGMG